MQVDDDTLVDATRDLSIKVSTWVEGGRRAIETVAARLASAPARVVVADARHGSVTGAIDTDASTELTVPVRNVGRTTAKDVAVRVERPADLPAGVELAQLAVPGTYWACTPDGDALSCTAPAILPGMPYDLGVRVTVPALAGAALPVTDVDLTTDLTVVAATSSASAPVTVRSAPGQVAIDLTSPTSVDAGLDRVVGASMENVGGTTLHGIGAHVGLPAGVDATDLTVASGWSCDAAEDGADCNLGSLAPGATTRLEVALRASADATGDLTFAVDGAPVTARSTLDVMLPELSFADPLTAHFIKGRDGTLSFSVRNDGRGIAADVTATLTLPGAVGLVDLESADTGDWTCSTTDSATTTCTLDRLAPGATAALVLPAHVNAALSGRAVVEVAAGNRPGVSVSSEAKLDVTPAGLALRDEWTDGYAVTEIGAPVLTCDPGASSTCGAARNELDGSAQNNNFAMIDAKQTGATLKMEPSGQEIVFAGLYWSANRYASDEWSGPLNTVQLSAPGTEGSVDVTGEVLAQATDNASRTYYESFADVTGLITKQGEVQVSGVATAATRNDPTPTYYGGWALVVVFKDPGTHRDVTVYDGGAWVATDSSTTFDFASDAGQARVGVVAWDGDRGAGGGDRLTLNGTPLVPVRSNEKPGSADDAFTSTAMGSSWANSLGVDAKRFMPAELGEGVQQLTASTAGDQYLIGAVTITTTPR